MNGIIYKITNTINNKIYIGQTIQSLQNRWKRHCSNKGTIDELNMVIKKAILKYGKENFKIEVLEICEYNQLDIKESFYINLYDSYNKGYNSTKGGKSGRTRDFFNIEKQEIIISLYKEGFSLRVLAKEFQVSKQTIKLVLIKNNIELNPTRSYKLTSEIRTQILFDYKNNISRKEIQEKYKISKSYLSQLINGTRRI